MQLFAVAAPGHEEWVEAELRALPGVTSVQRLVGGVEAVGDEALLYHANLRLRIATRLLLRVASFAARDFAALERGIAAIDWKPYLAGPSALAVRVSSQRSRLYHTGAIEERVLTVLADRGLHRPQAAAGPELYLRVDGDQATVSLDSSGELLHRRGYRTEGGEAPLRETLAAVLLALSGWHGQEPLRDPTCGSGTLLIEAALVAGQRAPGLGRRFAFQQWPHHSEPQFVLAQRQAAAAARPIPRGLVGGSDLSPEALAVTRRNAERAGVLDALELDCRDVGSARLPPAIAGFPAGGLVLANPPYGKRIGDGNLRQLYRAIGQYARSAPGWRLGLLCPQPLLARAAARRFATWPLQNGGLRVSFCLSQPLATLGRRDYVAGAAAPPPLDEPPPLR